MSGVYYRYGCILRAGKSGWSTVNPVVMTITLVTQDGVPIDAVHLPPSGPRDQAKLADPGEGATDQLAAEALALGELAPSLPPGQRDLAIVIAHGFTMSWLRPMTWRLVQWFNGTAGVVTFDFRGHGRSGGLSTLGDKEVEDLDVAVRYARELGYQRVATVGFSMGGSVVLRHAALCGGTDAVVSVSSPGRWYYRGTLAMRRVHLAAERRLGRAFSKRVLNTRISPDGWPTPDPMPPAEAAAKISPVPVLIIHGDQDIYFPPDHGQQLYDAAKEPKEIWLIPGFGHAERHTDEALVGRIVEWADKASAAAAPAEQQTAS
jgi:pimeloyl-ACP methyl ester carboxylesterase